MIFLDSGEIVTEREKGPGTVDLRPEVVEKRRRRRKRMMKMSGRSGKRKTMRSRQPIVDLACDGKTKKKETFTPLFIFLSNMLALNKMRDSFQFYCLK